MKTREKREKLGFKRQKSNFSAAATAADLFQSWCSNTAQHISKTKAEEATNKRESVVLPLNSKEILLTYY